MRLWVIGLAVCAIGASADAAEFRPWTSFPDAQFKGAKLYRDETSGAYCYATPHSRIDADGAPNAYHPDDLKRARPPYLGLDNPANAGWPRTTWWKDVLAVDPADKSRPYVQDSGPYRGYFVAMTSLRVRNGNPIDPNTYVDSRSTPYTVLPGSHFPRLAGTGAPGDVGMAWNLANGRKTAFVIGDTGGGNDARLGEGSIAFFTALGGVNLNARTGAGVAPGVVRYVVFPNSRRRLGWPASPAAIDALAKELLTSVGGADALSGCGS